MSEDICLTASATLYRKNSWMNVILLKSFYKRHPFMSHNQFDSCDCGNLRHRTVATCIYVCHLLSKSTQTTDDATIYYDYNNA